MDSKLAYTMAVGVVAVLRLVELRVSSGNIARLKAKKAVERGQEHYPWMVAVHVGWLSSCVGEVWLADRPWIPWLGIAAALVFTLGMALRYWTIRTLGERWSTRVIAAPGTVLERGGPFRWMHHPNYLGVVLEIAALPLIHTAWLTAATFSAANAVVLRQRIRVEESLLAELGGGEGQPVERRLPNMER
jgi:methyltransferase